MENKTYEEQRRERLLESVMEYHQLDGTPPGQFLEDLQWAFEDLKSDARKSLDLLNGSADLIGFPGEQPAPAAEPDQNQKQPAEFAWEGKGLALDAETLVRDVIAMTVEITAMAASRNRCDDL